MNVVEEILINMGYIRADEAVNIQDKLDFLRFWDKTYEIQLKKDTQKQTSTIDCQRRSIALEDLEVPPSDESDGEAKKETEMNLLLVPCSNDSVNTDKSDEKKVYQSVPRPEQKVEVKTLIKCLLNLSGVWKSHPSFFKEFQQLRLNRDEYYNLQIRQHSVKTVVKQHIVEQNRKLVQQLKESKGRFAPSKSLGVGSSVGARRSSRDAKGSLLDPVSQQLKTPNQPAAAPRQSTAMQRSKTPKRSQSRKATAPRQFARPKSQNATQEKQAPGYSRKSAKPAVKEEDADPRIVNIDLKANSSFSLKKLANNSNNKQGRMNTLEAASA